MTDGEWCSELVACNINVYARACSVMHRSADRLKPFTSALDDVTKRKIDKK